MGTEPRTSPIELVATRAIAEHLIQPNDWVVVFPAERAGYLRIVREVEIPYRHLLAMIRRGDFRTASDAVDEREVIECLSGLAAQQLPREILDPDRHPMDDPAHRLR